MAGSKRFLDKLNTRLNIETQQSGIDELLRLSHSIGSFNSQDEFQRHLTEGAMLNVGVLASKALSIPCGDYMVWMTDAGHTMLVPVREGTNVNREVFEHTTDQYDIFTNTLMQNWNKLQKTINEDEDFGGQEEDEGDAELDSIKGIDASTVERKQLLRAMQDRGHTVTSLANAIGVDPPAISRILRTPKDTQGDPGGRNPSMGMAAQVCGELRIDPTSAFPDIFTKSKKYEARSTPGNRGSGMSGAAAGSNKKGKASEKWSSGNS